MLISIRTFRGPSHHVRHSLPPDSRPKQLGCGFVPRPSVFVVSSVRSLLCNYGALTAEQRARGVAESCKGGLTQPLPGVAGRRRVGAVFHK